MTGAGDRRRWDRPRVRRGDRRRDPSARDHVARPPPRCVGRRLDGHGGGPRVGGRRRRRVRRGHLARPGPPGRRHGRVRRARTGRRRGPRGVDRWGARALGRRARTHRCRSISPAHRSSTPRSPPMDRSWSSGTGSTSRPGTSTRAPRSGGSQLQDPGEVDRWREFTVSSDRRVIAGAQPLGRVYLWDLATGRLVGDAARRPGTSGRIAFESRRVRICW